MCGIFGSVYSENRVDTDAALQSIRYRGPDQQASMTKGRAVFGFVRLAILDLSPRGSQPMETTDGDVMLVFNGEIYNHHELRKILEREGVTFRSRTDTEVILQGYRKWGAKIIERIDGMFGLAIYDVKARTLLLARDRAGKKPVFYTQLGGGLRFASEIKALFASGMPRAMRADAIAPLLAFGYCDAPNTFYQDIFELLPGHTLTLHEGGSPRIERYYTPPFLETPLTISVAEAERETARLVEAAVKRRLEADVPLGAFLSGGVDSSIIVGLMARNATQRVKTFSIGFKGDDQYDETSYARAIAQTFNTDHTEFRVEASSFDLVESLVHLHDGPFGDFSAIPTSIVSMLTRKHVTVALTGDGGDELFCGYTRFLAGEVAARVPQPMWRALGTLAKRLPRGTHEKGLPFRVQRFLNNAADPLAERLVGFSPFFGNGLESLCVPGVLDTQSPVRFTEASLAGSESASPLAQLLHHNYTTYLPYDLLVKADRASMLHSLELRSPFLDTELVKFAARLPDSLKRRGRTTKWILKRAFADLLPPIVATRGKMGFTPPFSAWARNELKTQIQDQFASNARMYTYVQRDRAQTLLREHLEKRADHGGKIWLLLSLEVWLRSLERELPSGSAVTA
jgi:asparagine synthase (glutamine-hydrolysing)